ncbi:MAG TPA: hypothetical protein VE998_02850, partial [Terriglobales bacterium]|nr:hypothetical protein [Terriglobales bacterium]
VLPRAWSEGQRHARIHAEADGELLGTIPVRIFAVPDALTLLVPSENADRPSSATGKSRAEAGH